LVYFFTLSLWRHGKTFKVLKMRSRISRKWVPASESHVLKNLWSEHKHLVVCVSTLSIRGVWKFHRAVKASGRIKPSTLRSKPPVETTFYTVHSLLARAKLSTKIIVCNSVGTIQFEQFNWNNSKIRLGHWFHSVNENF
jgi:hypothetical protein